MISIEQVINLLKADQNFRIYINQGHYSYQASGVDFTRLSYDSRTVDAETLFFVKGAHFKKEFLQDAVNQGLAYYVAEKDYEVGIPVILVNDIKRAMSILAMEFYDHPEEKLQLLAFTGTKGKTTAAYIAYHILSLEFKPAMLSTMNTTLDGKTFFKSNLTTPESLDLFAMMDEAVKNGRTHLIMEVSSQAYLVKRVYGLTFDVGVFLNISPDHIGPIEHPSFDDYFYHKSLLLKNSRFAVINSQMKEFDYLTELMGNREYDAYGDLSENKIVDSQAFSFDVTGKLAGHYAIQLIGYFNQENALAAGLACLRPGSSISAIQQGIAETVVPGRMEVLQQENGAQVFIDYAHNGDSLQKLLDVVLEHQKGQVQLIIGAPGNKGESRRKDFGLLLNDYPQVQLILSADDPNYEDPLAICQEIASYLDRPYQIIVNREVAIQTALSQTQQEGDAVVIAGKGADAYQIVQGQKDHSYLGDRIVAEKYL